MTSFLPLLNLLAFLLISSVFFGCSQKTTYIGNPKATKYTSAARHRATMRPYKVFRKRYYPTYVQKGEVMHGISSWYGPNFHGKYTSNGEVYNMHARTAAHKTWPMDTMVHVKNLENGKSTIVRINDRGPFVSGRIIDCSYAAGKEIGLDKMGIAKVRIEVLGIAGQINPSFRITKKETVTSPSRRIMRGYGLQLAVFSRYKSAQILKRKYDKLYQAYQSVIRQTSSNGMRQYKVIVTGFRSKSDADAFKYKHDLSGAFIVQD